MGLQGMRKTPRIDPVMEAAFTVPAPLINAVYFFGKVKAGKTTAMLSLSGKYMVYRGYKIFDLWGGSRNENMWWCLPSEDTKYWDLVKKRLRLNEEGPLQYDVNLLYPIMEGMPSRVPFREEHVFPKFFTIPFRNITIADIKLVVGNLSSKSEVGWERIIRNSKKSDKAPDLIEACNREKLTNTTLYRSFIEPLCKMKLLAGDDCEYNIDVKREARERKRVTVLAHEYIPERYKLFVMGYLLRQMKVLLKDGKIKPKNIIILREVSEFFRATEKSVVEDRFKVFKLYIADYIKMGRRGMHLFCDVQSPSEVSGIAQGNEDYTILGKIPGELDRKFATDQLRRDGNITPKQIKRLGELEPGQYLITEPGKHAKERYFFLPRSMYWREGYVFTKVWGKKVDTWKSTKTQLEEVKKVYYERLREIEDKKKILKATAKERKKIIEEQEERKRFEKEMEKEKKRVLEKEKIKEEVKKIKREALNKARADVKNSERDRNNEKPLKVIESEKSTQIMVRSGPPGTQNNGEVNVNMDEKVNKPVSIIEVEETVIEDDSSEEEDLLGEII